MKGHIKPSNKSAVAEEINLNLMHQEEVEALRKENRGLKIFIGEMVLQHRLKGGSISEIIG